MALYNSKGLFDGLICTGAYTQGNNEISNFNLAISTFLRITVQQLMVSPDQSKGIFILVLIVAQQLKFFLYKLLRLFIVSIKGTYPVHKIELIYGVAYKRGNNKIKNCMGL